MVVYESMCALGKKKKEIMNVMVAACVYGGDSLLKGIHFGDLSSTMRVCRGTSGVVAIVLWSVSLALIRSQRVMSTLASAGLELLGCVFRGCVV